MTPTRDICAGGITTLLNKLYTVLRNLFMKNWCAINGQ